MAELVSGWTNGLTSGAEIRRIVVERRDDRRLYLSVCFVGEESQGDTIVTFDGVQELVFVGPLLKFSGPERMMVSDIRSKGWEGLRWAVEDWEGRFVSFYCAGIEARTSSAEILGS